MECLEAAVNCEHDNDTTGALSSDNFDLIKYCLDDVQVLTSNFERVTRELEERNEMFAINPVKSDESARDVGLHPLHVPQALEIGDNKSHELLALSPRKSGGISSSSSEVGYQSKCLVMLWLLTLPFRYCGHTCWHLRFLSRFMLKAIELSLKSLKISGLGREFSPTFDNSKCSRSVGVVSELPISVN